MKLRVLRPSAVAVNEQVSRVRGEAPHPVGSFTLLPRHIDIVTTLAQGILSFTREDGAEVALAVDGGTLAKVGDDVIVSSPNVVVGVDAESLLETIHEHFSHEAEQDRRSRTALDHMSSSIVDRLVEFQEMHHRG
ncbi:MAG: F0F1 ATP synthase subunit epsilon [Candidatus Limnocylindrales bacterium]